MESSHSTHEQSSNIPNEEDSNIHPGRISRVSRPTFQPRNQAYPKEEINKINETLPIKKTISSYNFKIVLIGNVSVGKSSIIKRFIHNEFNEKYTCTIGTESFNKTLLIGENKNVNLRIWDTCGQEKFRTVTRQYYRDAQAILIVFDLTKKQTFDDLNSWYEEAINYINNTNCLFFLLGNKSDKKDSIVVENDEIKNFIRKNRKIKKYFEVSALDGHNIDLSFDKISQYLVMKFGGEEINKNMKGYQRKLTLENNDNNTEKKGCC